MNKGLVISDVISGAQNFDTAIDDGVAAGDKSGFAVAAALILLPPLIMLLVVVE